jgi:hypothetical protein
MSKKRKQYDDHDDFSLTRENVFLVRKIWLASFYLMTRIIAQRHSAHIMSSKATKNRV